MHSLYISFWHSHFRNRWRLHLRCDWWVSPHICNKACRVVLASPTSLYAWSPNTSPDTTKQAAIAPCFSGFHRYFFPQLPSPSLTPSLTQPTPSPQQQRCSGRSGTFSNLDRIVPVCPFRECLMNEVPYCSTLFFLHSKSFASHHDEETFDAFTHIHCDGGKDPARI